MENEELGIWFFFSRGRKPGCEAWQFGIGHFRVVVASVSKRVFMSNHSYENVFDLQRHFHGNQIYFHEQSFA